MFVDEKYFLLDNLYTDTNQPMQANVLYLRKG
jgi:hypothetical protein